MQGDSQESSSSSPGLRPPQHMARKASGEAAVHPGLGAQGAFLAGACELSSSARHLQPAHTKPLVGDFISLPRLLEDQ